MNSFLMLSFAGMPLLASNDPKILLIDPYHIIDILKAEYIPDYTIHLWFSDGAEQEIEGHPIKTYSIT